MKKSKAMKMKKVQIDRTAGDVHLFTRLFIFKKWRSPCGSEPISACARFVMYQILFDMEALRSKSVSDRVFSF